MRLFYSILFLVFFTSCMGQSNKLPEAVIVKAPTSVSKKITPNDSAYLKIKIGTQNFNISLLNSSLSTNDINNIDKFISANENKIDKNKIVVIGQSAVTFHRFKALKEVLKKHELYRFTLVTEPE